MWNDLYIMCIISHCIGHNPFIVHVYVGIHLCNSMWSSLVETNMCSVSLSSVYICIDQLSRGGGGDRPLTSLTPLLPQTHFFVLLPSQHLHFQRHMLLCVCVQWVQLRWKVIVRFVFKTCNCNVTCSVVFAEETGVHGETIDLS